MEETNATMRSLLIPDFPLSSFFHNYTWIKDLGSGTYGHVSLYKENASDAQRAVKRIKKKNLSESAQLRLRSEAALMRELDHPNLVKLFAVYEDEHELNLVMEFCDKGELFVELEKVRRFSEPIAGLFIKQVMQAIAYMDTKGICHRDLKPENFLLCSNNILKVADFGLSKRFLSEDKDFIPMFTRAGTPFYVAPEILYAQPPSDQYPDGVSYTSKSDVWSVGAVAYFLLSGMPPFFGKDDRDTLSQVLRGKVDLSKLDGISEEGKHFILRCLDKSPSRRISACDAIVHPWIKKIQTIESIPGGKALGDYARSLYDPSMETNNSNGFAPAAAKYQLDNQLIRGMKRFQCAPALKKMALRALAHLACDVELEHLRMIFQTLDKDCDGLLTSKEFKEGLEEANLLSKFPDVDVFLSRLGNKNVEWSDFIASALAYRLSLKEDALLQAFRLLDKEGKGILSGSNVMELFNDKRVVKIFHKDIQHLQSHKHNFAASDDSFAVVINGETMGGEQVPEKNFLTFSEFVSVMTSKAFDPSQSFTQSQEYPFDICKSIYHPTTQNNTGYEKINALDESLVNEILTQKEQQKRKRERNEGGDREKSDKGQEEKQMRQSNAAEERIPRRSSSKGDTSPDELSMPTEEDDDDADIEMLSQEAADRIFEDFHISSDSSHKRRRKEEVFNGVKNPSKEKRVSVSPLNNHFISPSMDSESDYKTACHSPLLASPSRLYTSPVLDSSFVATGTPLKAHTSDGASKFVAPKEDEGERKRSRRGNRVVAGRISEEEEVETSEVTENKKKEMMMRDVTPERDVAAYTKGGNYRNIAMETYDSFRNDAIHHSHVDNFISCDNLTPQRGFPSTHFYNESYSIYQDFRQESKNSPPSTPPSGYISSKRSLTLKRQK